MEITIYTDGGCEPNPGKGSWAFVCTAPYIERSGTEYDTTNNRMEMMAVLKAIEFGLEMKADKITIYSDSQYVVKGFTQWMHKWAKKGWKRGDELVKNDSLWRHLFKHRHAAKVIWVRGHNGNEYNEVADQIVRKAYMDQFGGSMKY